MAYDLPVDVATNDTGHASLHNAANAAVNDLDSRATEIEDAIGAGGLGGGGSGIIGRDANNMYITSGSPVLYIVDGSVAGLYVPHWKLPASVGAGVGATIVAADLALAGTVAVDLLWLNRGASLGDIKMQMTALLIDDGTTATGENDGGGQWTEVLAADAQYKLNISQMGTFAGGAGIVEMRCFRFADDAADTLANDAGIVGFRLRSGT